MIQRFEGKTAIVTAAAQGIGLACVGRLMAEGARVLATDVNATALAELPESIETAVLDVTNHEAVVEFVNSVPQVDILINCAGYVHTGSIVDCEFDDWKKSIDVNITGMYHMIKEVIPGMRKKNQGAIINIASAISSIKGAPNRFAYGTTKAAVIGLTKSIAVDFVKEGIRCNCVCPGMVSSPSLHQRIIEIAKLKDVDPSEIQKSFVSGMPIGRMASPEEIAGLVTYLASDEASYITGAVQVIDGGWSN